MISKRWSHRHGGHSCFSVRESCGSPKKIIVKILPLMRNEERKGNIKAENLAGALDNFGYLRRTQGDSKEAELSFRESLALSSQMPTRVTLYHRANTKHSCIHAGRSGKI